MTPSLHLSGPTSHHYFSQRLRLHYLDWGNPNAPLLLLVHGGYDHAHSWDWIAQEFCKDYHVVAPDFRGHGDSAWSPDGSYEIWDFVYDLAQLIHNLPHEQLSIIAHSMGGGVATRYVGLYPEKIRRFIVIEGAGRPPNEAAERAKYDTPERWRRWIAERRIIVGKERRRYKTIEDAFARMKNSNAHISDEQTRHLTINGVTCNEDGTYSWKYDNFFRQPAPVSETDEELQQIWGNITCPTLMCQGRDSMMSDPSKDGRLAHFPNARMQYFDNAGHWLQHDQFEQFVAVAREFLA